MTVTRSVPSRKFAMNLPLSDARVTVADCIKCIPDHLEAKQCRTLKGMYKLGYGTGRSVYGFSNSNDFVLKVARNKLGRLQNEVEFRTFDVNFTTQVFARSSCFDWILCERVEPMKTAHFRARGVRSTKFFKNGVLTMAHNPKFSAADCVLPELFWRIRLFLNKWPQLMPYEFDRFSSWGLRNELPVLLDYGWTYEVNWHRSAFENGIRVDPLSSLADKSA